MKTKLEINVTEGDIKRGIKENTLTCPIARATNRAFKYKEGVAVGVWTLSLYLSKNKPILVNLPIKAQRFIIRFDDGKKVKPFKFILRYEK